MEKAVENKLIEFMQRKLDNLTYLQNLMRPIIAGDKAQGKIKEKS